MENARSLDRRAFILCRAQYVLQIKVYTVGGRGKEGARAAKEGKREAVEERGTA